MVQRVFAGSEPQPRSLLSGIGHILLDHAPHDLLQLIAPEQFPPNFDLHDRTGLYVGMPLQIFADGPHNEIALFVL